MYLTSTELMYVLVIIWWTKNEMFDVFFLFYYKTSRMNAGGCLTYLSHCHGCVRGR